LSLQENRLLINAKQYRKLIEEDSERSYNQYILFKIAAAACHESGGLLFLAHPVFVAVYCLPAEMHANRLLGTWAQLSQDTLK